MSVHNGQSQSESGLRLAGSGRDLLRIVVVGDADNGQPALAGRLLPREDDE